MRRRQRIAAWRAGLPERIAGAARRWGFAPGETLAEGEASRILSARGPDGSALVLKCALPGQGLGAEAAALAALAGRGVARLVAADPAEGLLLLERAVPGTPLLVLARQDDEAALRIAARFVGALPAPVPPGGLFAEAAGWGRALATARGRLPQALLDRASGLLAELSASAPERLLLHGDLHPANILRHGEGWIAVDPKGLIGERAAEAACLLRHPADPAVLVRAPRRIALLAEAARLDRQRLAAWGYVAAAIAAAWAVQDGADPSPWLVAAEATAPLLSPRGSG
ncbi:MAG: aminoglycoside phosphotransferase family protein [Acetobacteraceae bacterium]|nr:aminoglycoside phosphotransferase family protein [Acetobacteraceae bacterium]